MLDPDAWRLGYFSEEELPEYLLMRSNEERFRDFQERYRDRLNNHFYITVVPKTLDVLECCLTLLPKNFRFFLILNGLARWEQEFLDRVYPNIPKFTLLTINRSILYDRVLDMLMECNHSNFGIIDQDCFVVDNRYFAGLKITNGEFVISPFFSVNRQANTKFPRTYLLFFDTQIMRRIRTQYELSFKRCWTIPSKIESQLSALNLGYHNFPHDSLGYFDNFQLIWAMALYQGLSFGAGPTRMLLNRPYRIVHVGAAHNYLTEQFRDQMIDNKNKYEMLPKLEKEKFRAAVFSYYAHSLLLENTNITELKERYCPFFSYFGGAKNIFKTFGAFMSPQKIKEMDLVIGRLRTARRMAAGDH